MEDIDTWKKKRRTTLCVYLLFGIVYGIDSCMVEVTVLPYMKEFVDEQKIKFFYTMSFVFRAFSASLSSIIIGRLVDRSRNVRAYMYLCTIGGIVGNILYTIPYSPYITVTSRAISGIFAAGHYILRSELIRLFIHQPSILIYHVHAFFY